jgi:hypothetical protein
MVIFLFIGFGTCVQLCIYAVAIILFVPFY